MVRMLLVLLLTTTSLSTGLKLNADSIADSAHPLLSYTFKEFVATYQRTYQPGSAEWSEREKTFTTNLGHVVAQLKTEGLKWKAGVNKFLDWTVPEKKKLLGSKPHHKRMSLFHTGGNDHSHSLNLEADIPEVGVDWSTHVSLQKSGRFVRDQGQCGSCWAVSTAAVMEAHLEKNQQTQLMSLSRYSNFTSMALSSQTLVSCTPNPQHCGGTGGCEGATFPLAYDYILSKGLPWGLDVPYTSGNGQSGTCADTQHAAKVHISNWVQLEANNNLQLHHALIQVGPVGVSVAAGSWFSYTSGIFHNSDDWDGNHAVACFGFGKEGDEKYWLVKNSWGSSWGENGFIRIRRQAVGDEANCGMDMTPQDGDACEGDNTPVQLCGDCGILGGSTYPVGVTVSQ